MVQEFLRGTWWRFDRYDVGQDYIRPADGARLECFDPWQQHAELARHRRDYEPPYVTLARLCEKVTDAQGVAEPYDPVPQGVLDAVADWCAQWGLLGALLLGLQALTPAIRWRRFDFGSGPLPYRHPTRTPFRGKHVVPVATTYEWSAGGWRRNDLQLALAEEDLSKWPRGNDGDLFPARHARVAWRKFIRTHVPPPGYALRRNYLDIDGGRSWELEALDDFNWAQFFPDAADEDTDTFDYPEPGSETFWHLYAEPLGEFAAAGAFLMQALNEIKHPEKPGWFGTDLEPDGPVETLRRLLAPIAPDLEPDPDAAGRFRARWSSPSLQSTLALMAYVDLTGGDRIDSCPVCGNIFVAHRADHAYCSPRCKATARKRRQRTKKPTGGTPAEPDS